MRWITKWVRRALIVCAVFALAFSVYVGYVAFNPLYLLAEPSYQYFNNANAVVKYDNVNFTTYGQIEVYGTPTVSDSNPFTFWIINWYVPAKFIQEANITTVAFNPEQAFHFPINRVGSNSYLPSLVESMHDAKGDLPGLEDWSGMAQAVYFTSGTFDARLSFANSQGFLVTGSVELQNFTMTVAGQDVTFSYVSNLVNICLTLVIVAFIFLEFRREMRDHKEYQGKGKKIGGY